MKYLKILLLIFFTSKTYCAQIPEVHCLQRIILHEARGESKQGMIAVGSVVLNRVKSKEYPDGICAVALQPKQFSGFRLDKRLRKVPKKTLEQSEVISKGLLSGEVKRSLPAGFLWFANVGSKKDWMQGMQSRVIGSHVFYRKSKVDRNK